MISVMTLALIVDPAETATQVGTVTLIVYLVGALIKDGVSRRSELRQHREDSRKEREQMIAEHHAENSRCRTEHDGEMRRLRELHKEETDGLRWRVSALEDEVRRFKEGHP